MDASDHVEVRRLLDTYADIVCRRAWDELTEIFDPEISIRVAKAGEEALDLTGTDAFVAFVGPAVDRFDFFLFQILNVRIEEAGPDQATARTFMSELRQDADGFSLVFGRYDDTFVRTDGRWLFTERRYRTLARTAVAGATRLDVFDR